MNHRLKWAALSRILKQAADKACLKRSRIHNHMLRHGSGTVNARYLTDSELKIRYGWAMDSRMPAVYVHLSSQDLDDKLQSISSGKPVEAKRPELSQSSVHAVTKKTLPAFTSVQGAVPP